MLFVSKNSLIVVCVYLVLNIIYSLKLKNIALLDVTIISSGFVLRIFAGSYAYSVTLTTWIVIMTFLLALFLALAKRRDDVLILQKTGKKMRNLSKSSVIKFNKTIQEKINNSELKTCFKVLGEINQLIDNNKIF